MKKSIRELLEERKAEVKFRTDRTQAMFGRPQLSVSPVVFEVSEKTRAVAHGGIPLIHQIAVQSGLVDAINEVAVLLLHLPYHESDHLLNLAYNFFCAAARHSITLSIVGKTRRTSTCLERTRFPIRQQPAIFAGGIRRNRSTPCRTRSTTPV
jgi:hypothetical protein